MKDRNIPCNYYVCAGSPCGKGFSDVTMRKCKNCKKYRPRKVSVKEEPIRSKRQRDRDRHDDWRSGY